MNTAPFFWLIAAVGFLVLEGCTFNMTSIWFAIGAAAALISCLFTDLFRVQALLFIVVSVLCLLAFRPLAAKLRKAPTATNGDRNRRGARPCPAGRRGLERPLRDPRRHSEPRRPLPRHRDPQHPAPGGAYPDRKPQELIHPVSAPSREKRSTL